MDKEFDAGTFATELDLSKFDRHLVEELRRLSVLQSQPVESSLKRSTETERYDHLV